MDISIRDLGGCRKELAVVVPASEVDAELEKAIDGVRGQVSLPGFRQGKVPRALIEKKFGLQVKDDVTHELVGKAVEKALLDHALDLVSQPEIDTPPAPAEPGQDLKFTFKVEVKPTFDLPEYKGLQVTKTIKAVTDANVDAVIEDIRFRHGVMKPVPEGAAFAHGDWALSDVEVKEEGAVLKSMVDVPLGGDPPRIRGFDAPEIGSKLAGVKAGDAFDVPAVMATDVHHDHDHDHEEGDEHHHHHHETKPVTLSVKIKEIKRRELPEIDDAFAKEVGQETVLAMRVAVRKRLDEAHAKAAEKEVENQMLDILVDRSNFEMAQGPVDRALAARIDRVVLERMIRGESEESARAAVEADRAKIREVVERDAKAWLIVEKLAKKEKIFALEDDVAKEIARIAEEQGTTPTKVREHYESQEMMPEVRANVLERKVLDFLRGNSTITESREDGAAGAGARAEAGEVEGT